MTASTAITAKRNGPSLTPVSHLLLSAPVAETVSCDPAGAACDMSPLKGGPPKLKDAEKIRILYLFSEAFRKEPGIGLCKVARLVAEQVSQECGRPITGNWLRRLYNRQATPLPERPPVKKKKARPKLITEELKAQVAYVLADPDIPLEMKSIRKIREVLPDCPVSTTSIQQIFRELKKDKLLPKPPKKPRKHRPKELHPHEHDSSAGAMSVCQ